jgi:aconitase B
MAKVYNKMRNLEKAIEAQQKAMDTFSQLEKYADTDYLAQIVMTLSEF